MLRQASLYFVFRAGNGVVALLSLMLLTRWLAPEQYGHYAIGMSAANVISALGFQWLNVSVGRFYSSPSTSPDRLMSTAFRYATGVGAAVILTAVVWAAASLTTAAPEYILATATLGVALGFHNLHLQLLNAQQDTLRFGWLTATRAWLALLLALAAVWYGGKATGALAGVAFGSVVAVFMFAAKRPNMQLTTGDAVASDGDRNLLKFGLPLSLSFLSIALLDAADRFMLNHWHGATAVASYGATFDLVQQTVGATLNVLYLAAYPKIVAAWEQGGVDAARAKLQPLRRTMLFIAPLAVLMFSGLAFEVTHLVLGANIAAEAATVMLPVALAVAFSGMRAFCFDIALHLRHSTRMQVLTTALMASVNVALNLVLIPRFGAVGAAWASAAAFGCGLVASLWFGRADQLFTGISKELIAATLACMLALLAVNTMPAVFDAALPAALSRAAVLALVFIATLTAAKAIIGKRQ